jgi:hypothetical protein
MIPTMKALVASSRAVLVRPTSSLFAANMSSAVAAATSYAVYSAGNLAPFTSKPMTWSDAAIQKFIAVRTSASPKGGASTFLASGEHAGSSQIKGYTSMTFEALEAELKTRFVPESFALIVMKREENYDRHKKLVMWHCAERIEELIMQDYLKLTLKQVKLLGLHEIKDVTELNDKLVRNDPETLLKAARALAAGKSDSSMASKTDNKQRYERWRPKETYKCKSYETEII